jgi:hypothetical protein
MITDVAVLSETLFSLENEPAYSSVCIGPARRRRGRKVGYCEGSKEHRGAEKGRVGRGESGWKRVAPAREI